MIHARSPISWSSEYRPKPSLLTPKYVILLIIKRTVVQRVDKRFSGSVLERATQRIDISWTRKIPNDPHTYPADMTADEGC